MSFLFQSLKKLRLGLDHIHFYADAIVNEFGAGIIGGLLMVILITIGKKIISLFKK
jgi:hypothetical protein